MDEKEISPAEEEGRMVLESKILMELPDIEDTLWKYHPLRQEHSCCFSKGTKSRTIMFPRQMLVTMSKNPDAMEEVIQNTIQELKRRVL